MWNRKEFEDAAENIALKHTESKGVTSINKLAEDMARSASLNPDGIRTMVRLANVSVFEKLFAEKTGEDRMIEYEPGDAEVVINSIFAAEKVACEKQLAEKDAYNRAQDYYSSLSPSEKTANASEHFVGKNDDRGPTRQGLKYVAQRAREKLAEDQAMAKYRWTSAMEKLAYNLHLFAQAPAARARFEKLAVASLGEQVIPELQALNLQAGRGMDFPLFGGEKLADVLDRFSTSPSSNERAMLDFIEGAKHARIEVKNLTHGMDVLDQKIARM